jgi:prepilin-type N-terminal cleavage/methylation domain-containing protein
VNPVHFRKQPAANQMERRLPRLHTDMRAAGFSLVELLVAMAIVLAGVVSLARLFLVSADAARVAQMSSSALLLAQRKLEALRADAPALDATPAGTLDADTAGYVDYPSEGGTAFVRRWAIEPLPGSVREGLLVQVVVLQRVAERHRMAGATRLVTVIARR